MRQKKRKNPVSVNKTAKIKKAAALFEDFTGKAPKYIDKIKYEISDVALQIGQCDGILYTTKRNGKTEKYVHKFKRNSRPLLAVTYDGSTLLLLGGAFAFTDRGIVDR